MGLALMFRDLFAATYARAMGVPEVVPLLVPALLASGAAAAVVGTLAATALPVWRLAQLPRFAERSADISAGYWGLE